MKHASRNAYGFVAVLLHWLIALMIVGLLALGYVMTRPDIDPALQFTLFQWHKSFGMLVLALAILRFVHWLFSPDVVAVEGLSATERVLSSAMHRILLLLTLFVPLAGWAVASVSTLDIPTFMFNLFVVPHLPLARSEQAEALWSAVHATLAYAILSLVVAHALAALYHHIWRRDDVLLRMLGRGRSVSEEEKYR